MFIVYVTKRIVEKSTALFMRTFHWYINCPNEVGIHRELRANLSGTTAAYTFWHRFIIAFPLRKSLCACCIKASINSLFNWILFISYPESKTRVGIDTKQRFCLHSAMLAIMNTITRLHEIKALSAMIIFAGVLVTAGEFEFFERVIFILSFH